MSALDGEEDGSNGRVREFFRRVVCGDPESTSILRLPGWTASRSLGARLAARATGRPFPPVGGTLSADLSAEHTDSIIRSAEARLTASLHDALLEATRDAAIDTCLRTSSPLKREEQQEKGKKTEPTPAARHAANLNALPPKAADFSTWMDEAALTEKQRECFSLRKEYQLPKAQIARRLGISRPVVAAHIESAERKINQARANQVSSRRAAAKRTHE